MARPFSYPKVAALNVGESVTVLDAPASEVKRKTILYGGRNDKRFAVLNLGQYGVEVTRLPDPEPQP